MSTQTLKRMSTRLQVRREAQEGSHPRLVTQPNLLPIIPLLPFATSRPAPALLAAQPGERQLQRRLDQAPGIKTDPVGKQDGKATSYAINVLPHGAGRGGRWGCCSESPLGELQTEAEALELQSPWRHVPFSVHSLQFQPSTPGMRNVGSSFFLITLLS